MRRGGAMGRRPCFVPEARVLTNVTKVPGAFVMINVTNGLIGQNVCPLQGHRRRSMPLFLGLKSVRSF